MFDTDQTVLNREQVGTYFFVVVLSAFLGELLIMVALEAIHIESTVVAVLLDAALISLVVLTVTWHSMLRPFHGTLRTLELTRERYRSVVDAAGDMVFVLDEAGRITDTNRAAQTALDSKPHDLMGRRLSEFLQNDQGAPCNGVTSSCCGRTDGRTVRPSVVEGIIERRDGTAFPVSVRIGRADAGEDGSTRTVALIRDVTERKAHERELEDRTALLQTLIDAIPAPIFFKDRDFVYLGCNRAFEAFIGLERSQVVGKGVRDVAPPEMAEVYHTADQALFDSGEDQIYETAVRYADGTPHDVEFRKAIFRDANGAKAGIIGVMLDVTGRKREDKADGEEGEQRQAVG